MALAATKVGSAYIELTAQTDKYKRQMAEAEASGKKTGAAISSSFRKMDADIAGITGGIDKMKAGLIALGGALVFNEMNKLSDTFSLMRSRIRLVTKEGEDLFAIEDKLAKQAITNRSDLQSTVDLYTRLRQTREDLSDEATRELVDRWSKSLIISASSAAEAASSTMQFSQAMAAGVLQGQELRSVIQGNSAFAVYLAEALGVTTGQLKQMGEEGKLTTDVIFEGLQRVGDHIEKDFSKKALTVGQAMTNIETATLRLVGSIDQAFGGSQGLAGLINMLAGAIEAFTAVVRGNTPAISRMSEQTDALRAAIKATDEQIAKGGLKDLGDDAAAAIQPLTEVEAKIAAIQKRLEETGRGAKLNAISQIEGGLILQVTEIAELEKELKALKRLQVGRGGDAGLTVGSRSQIAATQKALDEARRAYGDALIRLDRLQNTPDSAFKPAGTTAAKTPVAAAAELRGYYTALETYERDLAEIRTQSAKGAEGANRAVIQSMMDYLDAGGSLRRVLKDVSELSGSLLDPESVRIINEFMATMSLAETINVTDALETEVTDFINADGGVWANYEQRIAEATKYGLMSAIETGEWGDAFGQILTDVTREALSNALDVLWEALSQINWGGQGEGWAGFLGMLGGSFSGNRASGGAVTGGRRYRVGEQGSEWFIPKQDGYIMPSNAGKSLGAPMQVSVGGAQVVIQGDASERTAAMIAESLTAYTRVLPSLIDQRVTDRQKRGAY